MRILAIMAIVNQLGQLRPVCRSAKAGAEETPRGKPAHATVPFDSGGFATVRVRSSGDYEFVTQLPKLPSSQGPDISGDLTTAQFCRI